MARDFLETVLSVVFPLPREDEEVLTLSEGTLLRTLPRAHAPSLPYPSYAGYQYRDARVRRLVHALKFSGSKKAASLCGFLLADALLSELESLYLFEGFIDPLLVPVPLSPSRYRERGFNQAARLGGALQGESESMGMLTPHALIRTIHTTPQSHLKAHEERRANVAHAFKVPHPSLVEGRNIILIDDVLTSGATATAAADALKEAGARTIFITAFAH